MALVLAAKAWLQLLVAAVRLRRGLTARDVREEQPEWQGSSSTPRSGDGSSGALMCKLPWASHQGREGPGTRVARHILDPASDTRRTRTAGHYGGTLQQKTRLGPLQARLRLGLARCPRLRVNGATGPCPFGATLPIVDGSTILAKQPERRRAPSQPLHDCMRDRQVEAEAAQPSSSQNTLPYHTLHSVALTTNDL
jgi:hypothetical protein